MRILDMPARTARFAGDRVPQFPASVTITVELRPRELFGLAPLTPSLRHGVRGRKTSLEADKYYGGIWVRTDGRLARVSFDSSLFGWPLIWKDNTATLEVDGMSEPSFQKAIHALDLVLPGLVSAGVHAPVWISSMYGTVSDIFFEMEAVGTWESTLRVEPVAERIRGRLDAFSQLPDGCQLLFSAYRYVQQARRLEYVATHPTEFVAERLLNLYKAVEVLLGRDTKALRSTVSALGAPEDVVETLVSLVYIRDSFDVGHPAISPLSKEEFSAVHSFASRVDDVVAWLLTEITTRVAAGTFRLRSVDPKGGKRDKTLSVLMEREVPIVEPMAKQPFRKRKR